MEPMTEYESHDGDHHHDAGTDSAAHDNGTYGDHISPHTDPSADTPSIPDDPAFHHTPDELHFPGEHPQAAGDRWADDEQFDRWLHEPHTPDDTADSHLREQLTPPDDAPGLASPDELVDWALRQGR